jgi:hypothetical protein
MKKSDEEVKGWQQLSMLSSGPRELILRIGVFPEADHAQFQVEIRTAGERQLELMEARPHVDWCEAPLELERWLNRVRQLLAQLDAPFP